jgi:TonB family protein
MDILPIEIPKDGQFSADVMDLMMPFQVNDDTIWFPKGRIVRREDTLSYNKPEGLRERIRKNISLNTTLYLAKEDVKSYVYSLNVSNFKSKGHPIDAQFLGSVSKVYDHTVVFASDGRQVDGIACFNKLESLQQYLVDSVLSTNMNVKVLCVIGWPEDVIVDVEFPSDTTILPITKPDKTRLAQTNTFSKVQSELATTPNTDQTPTLKYYTLVEEMPSYPGGQEALSNYISKNLKYPSNLKNSGISGTVYVSYIVDEKGSAMDVRLVKGVHPSLNEEAIRVVSGLRGFKPGRKEGKVVPVQLTELVRF